MLTHKELKTRALKRSDVKAEYEKLDECSKVNGLNKSLKRVAAKRQPRSITRSAHK